MSKSKLRNICCWNMHIHRKKAGWHRISFSVYYTIILLYSQLEYSANQPSLTKEMNVRFNIHVKHISYKGQFMQNSENTILSLYISPCFRDPVSFLQYYLSAGPWITVYTYFTYTRHVESHVKTVAERLIVLLYTISTLYVLLGSNW